MCENRIGEVCYQNLGQYIGYATDEYPFFLNTYTTEASIAPCDSDAPLSPDILIS